MNTAICLAGYGGLVALVAPRLLTVTITSRAPRLGMTGWFLAVTTVLLSWAGALAYVARTAPVHAVRVAAGVVLGFLAARILWALLDDVWRARAQRVRQRNGLALLGHRDLNLNAVLVDSPAAIVYCLPGRPSTVVVTTGARSALSGQQLRAVLAHERAHLAGRHSIALAAAYAISRALPQPALFRIAADQIAGLLEMRADDIAAGKHGSTTVATALAAMSASPVPALTLGAAGPTVLARARRLCHQEPPGRRRLTKLALALTALALAGGPYLASIGPICPHQLW